MDQPPPGAQAPRTSFSSLLFFTFVIFMLSGNGDDLNAHEEMYSALQSLQYQVSNYSAWLNSTTTNFTLTPEPPTLFPLVHALVPSLGPVDPLYASYYQNITGFIDGPIDVYNLTAPNMTSPWSQYSEPFSRGINQTRAHIRSQGLQWDALSRGFGNLREYEIKSSNNDASFIRGTFDFLSRAKSEVGRFQMDGIHFPKQGSFYALVEPIGMQPDIRQLSALVPDSLSNSTAYFVKEELDSRLERLENMFNARILDRDRLDYEGDTACSFHFYGQLSPSPLPRVYMEELEAEIIHPTGIPTIHLPPILLTGAFVSHNCGILVTVENATILKADSFWRKVITYAGLAFCIYGTLLVLLVQQMEATRTPAAISRVSRWTLAIQAVGDSYAAVAHIAVGTVSKSRASLPLIAPGFLAGTLFLVFGVRYATLAHRVQGPEDAATAPAPVVLAPAAAAAAAAVRRSLLPTTTNETQTPTLPTPTLVPTAVSPLRRAFDSINPVLRFRVILGFLFIALVQTVSSRLLFAAVFAFYSFWVPQIFRNAAKGNSHALQKRYVVGTSACRLFFAMYFYACPSNVLFLPPTSSIWWVFAWVWIQVAVLLGQEYFGSGFFLPKSWKPTKIYDYHADIPIPDAEAPQQSLGDCSVCLEPIIIRRKADVSKEEDSLLSSTDFPPPALAPCHHMFHTPCLEQWLSVKSICPVCRRHLPPL